MVTCGICNTSYMRFNGKVEIVFKPQCPCKFDYLKLKERHSTLQTQIDKMVSMKINPPITMTPIGTEDAITYTLEGYKSLEKKYNILRDKYEPEEEWSP